MTRNNRILVQNVYYMLSYAFRQLEKNNYEHIKEEDFENVLDLLAEILYRGVSEQLKKGLYKEYINRDEKMSILKGRLNIYGTIYNRIQRKQLLDCEYDELSENNLLNRILKSTVFLLLGSKDVKKDRKIQLYKILPFFSTVEEINLSYVKWKQLRYQRNNNNYEMLMYICRFILSESIMSNDGNKQMTAFNVSKLEELFEAFVLQYYKRHYDKELVPSGQSHINWNVTNRNVADISFLPNMKSDIKLTYLDQTTIIDTKCYTYMTQVNNAFGNGKHTIVSENLYQIFSYVKNEDVNNTGNVSGMLLYAKTIDEIIPSLDAKIGGNRFVVRTLDLNQEFNLIRKQLDGFVTLMFPDFPTHSRI